MAITISARVTGDMQEEKGLSVAAFNMTQHPIFSTLQALLADGIGQGQINKLYVSDPAAAEIAADGSFNDLDLSGVEPDVFGDIVSFTSVKALIIVADQDNINDLIVGGASGSVFVGPFGAASHKQNVKPGGFSIHVAPKDGWPVTGATDQLRFANGGVGSDVKYHILIAGIG